MPVTAQDIADYHSETEKGLNRLRVLLRHSQTQLTERNESSALDTLSEIDDMITDLANSNEELFQKCHSVVLQRT